LHFAVRTNIVDGQDIIDLREAIMRRYAVQANNAWVNDVEELLGLEK
jgi:hypothetical protein